MCRCEGRALSAADGAGECAQGETERGYGEGARERIIAMDLAFREELATTLVTAELGNPRTDVYAVAEKLFHRIEQHLAHKRHIAMERLSEPNGRLVFTPPEPSQIDLMLAAVQTLGEALKVGDREVVKIICSVIVKLDNPPTVARHG